MRDWKGEIREAIAGANLKADAAREEAVVEELAQDLTERYEDLVGEGVEEAGALRRLRGELREPGFLAGLRPRLEARSQTLTPGVERRERLLQGVQRDVRLGARLLRANPAFALVAILSLALGIGANAAIFELLDAVLLQTRPELGRLLTKSDDYKGCGVQGAVISDGFWHREFAGRADAIGKTVSLDGQPFQIIGVTPASFSGLEPGFYFDVAVPLCSETAVHGEHPYTADATTWWLAVTGRLKPGWTAQSVAVQLNAAAPAIFAATLPAEYDAAVEEKYLKFTFRVLPAATGVSELRANYTAPLFVLLGISGLVLLIACANLANLMMARASAREREMALRMTLGASRGRLIQQMLVESLLLATVGAAAGAALAQVLSKLMVGFISSEDNPIFLPLSADWRFLLFTTMLGVLTCLLCGTAPALQAARSDPGYALKGSGRGSTAGRRGLAVRRGLVVSQVALSLVLLVTALLFVRTFTNLVSVNAGLRQD